MSETSRHLIRATESIAKNLGVKFCTACNLTKSVGGGKIKQLSNGRTRWMCATCAARKKPTGFKQEKL
jgi:hypothetical protein